MTHIPAPGCVRLTPALGVTFALVMPRPSLTRRLVSLLLAVLVLTASVGLTVQRLTCRVSGRSQVGIALAGQPTGVGYSGCLAPARTAAKELCCEFSSHLHKLSAPAHELATKLLVSAPLLTVWLPAGAWQQAAPVATRRLSGPCWFAADSSPPGRGGRDLLTFVGKWRV